MLFRSMTQVLIDTDVILDFFFDRQPFAENASKIFSLSESKKIISFVTPVIISNVYYLLRQTATHEKVIEKLTARIAVSEAARATLTEHLETDAIVVPNGIYARRLSSGSLDQRWSGQLLCAPQTRGDLRAGEAPRHRHNRWLQQWQPSMSLDNSI